MRTPAAMRHSFDGDGWLYIDKGSGSDWMTRYPDAESLFAEEKHYHVRSSGNDRCAECGRDLRDPIHIRITAHGIAAPGSADHG